MVVRMARRRISCGFKKRGKIDSACLFMETREMLAETLILHHVLMDDMAWNSSKFVKYG
jgi:hypothetical protein